MASLEHGPGRPPPRYYLPDQVDDEQRQAGNAIQDSSGGQKRPSSVMFGCLLARRNCPCPVLTCHHALRHVLTSNSAMWYTCRGPDDNPTVRRVC